MSKKPRTFQPPASASKPAAPTTAADAAASAASSGGSAAPTTPGATGASTVGTSTRPANTPTGASTSGSSATSRSAARRRAATSVRVSAEPSFFERYRVLILGGIAVVLLAAGIAIVANLTSGSVNAYDCVTMLTPGPTDPVPTAQPAQSVDPAASPAVTPQPQPTQRLGFPVQDLGRSHIANTTKASYAYCPPASGNHYNIANQAPLPRQFYGPDTKLVPGNWVHNLEHGYVVLLYKGDIPAEEQQTLQDIMAEATPSATSGATCGYSKVIAVRFDDMNTPFAAIAWDRALLLPELEKGQLLTFVNQWQDGPQTPESGLC